LVVCWAGAEPVLVAVVVGVVSVISGMEDEAVQSVTAGGELETAGGAA
jgi:hypothetical protein